LAEAQAAGAPGLGRWTVLDLGCGTGLAGMALRDLAGRLEGVDLSARMLARARARGLYHSLDKADLVTTLAAGDAAYDLIVAADVLIYLGDLARVFSGAAGRLVPGGRFAFTLEKAGTPGWHLQPCRRYAHHPATIAAWSAAAGLEIAHWEDGALRTEAGRPVPSLLYVLKRPVGADDSASAVAAETTVGLDRLDA
jgi:predicted TPR repeat methyltransferase